MGSNCSCLQNESTKSEINLDAKRIKDISKFLFFI